MTLPDVCGPVSSHIRILSLRLRERGMGWQSGHPTLLSVIQWEPWFESQRYILCGCSKHELAGWEAITATQPAIYQRNWGCRMGQHCSLWIELKQGLSRSDTPLRGQGVLLSTHTHTHTHQHTQPCAYAYPSIQSRMTTVNTAWAYTGNRSEREGQFIKLEYEDSHRREEISHIWKQAEKKSGTHTHRLMHPPTCLCTRHQCPNTHGRAIQR